MEDKKLTMRLVGRSKPLLPDGETITTNAGSIRLAVYEGRIKPEDALEELDRIGCAQTLAHGKREYERGMADALRKINVSTTEEGATWLKT